MGVYHTFSSYRFFFAGIVILIFAGWLCLDLFFDYGRESGKKPAIFTVSKKSFSLFVMERGVVSPAQISPVSSQISSNQAKIVWLEKEGNHVKKDMLIARFDTKPFIDQLQKAEQDFGDAQATHIAAGKMLSLQKEEEEGQIEEAIRKQEIVRIQANNIRKGSGPLKRKVFEQKLHQASRSLKISRSELADLTLLLTKGHVSTRERDKGQDKVSTSDEQVQVARAELDNFNTYVWPQMQREAELLVNGVESDLQRVKRTADILIQNRMAEVEKSRRKVEIKRRVLKQSKLDVANCDIYSPTDGILLYSDLPRNNGHRKIQIGDSVWVGQTFLKVPDTSALIAEIYIREVDVARVLAGMKVEIEIDAFPRRRVEGRVQSVASLAIEDSENVNIRRFYSRIQFIGDTDKIHVGMSVTARIIQEKLRDVIAVPISAVFYDEGKTMVRKKSNEKWQKVPVALGARGLLWIEIIDGIAVGDQIYSEGQ